MKKLLLFFVSAFTIAGCSSDNDSAAAADQYDRGAMLQNWADNIIIPAYTNYGEKLTALKASADAFTGASSQENLDGLRAKWLEAYLAYQHVAMFNIGKAEELQAGKYINTYPANVTLITNKINSGDMALEGPANDVAQGFPAIDYLIYGAGGSSDAVLNMYTTNAQANNYKNYLTAVVNKLITLNTTVLNDWNGGYKNVFVSKTDNTSSGSVNRMVNAFVQFFEKEVRTGKVGIPAGKFSTTPLPEKVEGYYSRQFSKQLLLEALQAARNFFNGKHFGSATTGASLGTYLEFLNATGNGTNGSAPLKNLIDNQFATAQATINVMNADLYQQVVTDNNKMLESFDAMQRNVAYMKTDMVSAMSISIDYADTDGD